MKCKNACLVINPRDGQNLANLTSITAILAAADWNTDIFIKEYPGHTMELAMRAAKKDYDLLIAYGGDGTVNQVVNGVMTSKKSIFGTIPGGTVNQWAAEMGIPLDPVKATLALINSDVRNIDVGHIQVERLAFPSSERKHRHSKKKELGKQKAEATQAKHYFLLSAGFGIDAAVMGFVNKTLKHRVGLVAVGLAAAKALPAQRPFPIEIRVIDGTPNSPRYWRGEAIQVVISNTRRYANVVDMTPGAYVDDGILDACVITAGDPLSTVQQLTSIFLQGKPHDVTAEYFRGPHLFVTVPASIDFHLEGSTVKLRDYLDDSDRQALKKAQDLEQVMVTYRFDAVPGALQAAIPAAYNNTLFSPPLDASALQETSSEAPGAEDQLHDPPDNNSAQTTVKQSATVQPERPERVHTLIEKGRKVTIVGAIPHPNKHNAYIIAGIELKQITGESKPVAVYIDEHTMLIKHTGEHQPSTALLSIQEGEEIVVKGNKSRRSVIYAKRVMISD
ncbi:MAG: diacylglycerol/lipid kinase family protein [Ktedonobacteraceae bacterium]